MNREDGEILLFPWPAATACLRDDAGAMLLSNSSSDRWRLILVSFDAASLNKKTDIVRQEDIVTSEANVTLPSHPLWSGSKISTCKGTSSSFHGRFTYVRRESFGFTSSPRRPNDCYKLRWKFHARTSSNCSHGAVRKFFNDPEDDARLPR